MLSSNKKANSLFLRWLSSRTCTSAQQVWRSEWLNRCETLTSQHWRSLESFSACTACINRIFNIMLANLFVSDWVYFSRFAALILPFCLYMYFLTFVRATRTWTHATSHTNHPFSLTHTHSHAQCPLSHGATGARPNIWHCVRLCTAHLAASGISALPEDPQTARF